MRAAPITTANPISRITVIARLICAGFAVVCLVMQSQALQSYLTARSYHDLADDVRQGRLDLKDGPAVDAILVSQVCGAETVKVQNFQTCATLQLYRIDLTARRLGLSATSVSENTQLTEARQVAKSYLETVLSRAPHDGNLWLRLALVSRSLDPDDQEIDHYLAMSVSAAPHEKWITQLRDPLMQ